MTNKIFSRFFRSQSITKLIVTSIIVATMIPILIHGYKLYDVTRDNAWREAREKYQLLAENIAPSLSLYVDGHRKMLEALARHFARLKENISTVETKTAIEDLLAAFEGFHSISWVDTNGKVIFHQFREKYHATHELLDISSNENFVKARKGFWSISNSLVSPISGEPALLISQPVKNNHNEIDSIIIAELSILELEKLRQQIKFSSSGYIAFVDHQGNVLAHPNPTQINQAKNLANLRVVQQIMSGTSGTTTFYSPYQNEEMIAGFTTIPELGWGVIVADSKAKIDNQLTDTLLAQFPWIFAEFCLALFASFILARLISKPLHALMESTHQLVKNKYQGQVPQPSGFAPVEIQQLAQALGSLTKNIQNTQHDVADLTASLQFQMDEATQQLRDANKKLEIAAHDAEQSSRAKSSFLANMSHELRTPMNAIIGYSEILEEEALESEHKEILPDIRKIKHAGTHLLALISDILDLSKIEAGKMEMHLEDFDLQKIVEEISSTIAPLAFNNQNEFNVTIVEPLGTMRADATKLKQVLFNLLSNAFKFTHNGTVTLSIQRKTAGGNNIFEFEVKDTGIGMSQQQIKNLFTEFSQADTSTTRKYGGTGLGLAISRFFCHMMNGDIFVQSEPNKGSTFTVYIPEIVEMTLGSKLTFNETNHDNILPNPKPFRFNESTNKNWDGIERRKKISTVLIVDNDPTSRQIIERILRKKGFETKAAANAEEGLKIAKEYQPNIISIDVDLPENDGWRAIDEIKQDAELAKIPILILTMLNNGAHTWEEAGASAFLTKPINKNQLEKVIQHLARKRRRKTDH